MPKLLVVDDSEVFLDLLIYALKDAGFNNIDIASNGKDALEKAKNNKYNIILTDYYMPKLNGIDLIIALREMPMYKKTPILIVSTEFKDEVKLNGKKAGATGWIVKPFIPAQLTKAVSLCLQKVKV